MQLAETREIDGHVWTVVKFTGRKSLTLFRQLTALAADPLAEAAEKLASDLAGSIDVDFGLAELLSITGGALELAGKMAAKLSDIELEALATELLKLTQRDGKAVAFDLDFQGALPTLFQVLAFVVEINFVGPFAAWLGPAVSTALAEIRAKAGSLIPSPSSVTNSTQ